MKKRWFSLISLAVLFGILISLGIITYQERTDIFSTSLEGVGSETDRLLKDMGIAKVPQITIPVEINLKDMHGSMVRFSDFRGKIVFLNFWTTWCPPCREEMPAMEKLHQRLKGGDFVMVGINLQEPASLVRAFFKKFKLTFISLLDSDGAVGRTFGIRSIPTTLILDKEGAIMGAALGARKWDSRKAIALFEHLIKERKLRISEIKD
jgi:thiol-disulfide isomerase/thioredoxin